MSKMTPTEAYDALKTNAKDIKRISDSYSILNNDAQTRMQRGSAEIRGEMMQVLAKVIHERSTNPKIGEWLDKAEEGRAALSPRDQRNLDLMQKDWKVDKATPLKLAEEMALIESTGDALQEQQKTERGGRFADVKAHYKRAFDASREMGQIKKDVLGMPSAYDALLDTFSPGLNAQIVARHFAKLDQALPDLIQARVEEQNKNGPALPLGIYDVAQQMQLCDWGLDVIGFDKSRGRLDAIGGHPSCGGGTNDVRLTTHPEPSNFIETFKACVHEGGHGMYELALPGTDGQPVDNSQGMTLHESQSMIIEYQACMTPEFISLLALKAEEIFGADPSLDAENLQKLIHHVEPSLIRVYADELTYPMHVSLRTEIEKGIIDGTMSISDMPEAWNEGMKKRLNIVPENHADGCLQDVHWYVGLAGYFPAYALGAMTAAQLFDAAQKANPTLRSEIGRGDFTLLNEWLNTNIRGRGSEVEVDAIMREATGQTLNPDVHIAHLRARYLDNTFDL